MARRAVIFIFPICPVQCSDSCNPDTKLCLNAAGGIYVYVNFEHLAGTIQIAGSSSKNGGAVLRSSSGVFGRILRWL